MELRNLMIFALLVPLATACGARDASLPPDHERTSDALAVPLVPVAPDSSALSSDVASADRAACLGYDSTVVLSGVLRRETHPGRPNYESVADGDEPETGFYLHLATPACANEDRSVPDGAREDSVARVQLVLDSAGYAQLRPMLGRRVSLSGVLFSAFTGHHHAPLLLRDVARLR